MNEKLIYIIIAFMVVLGTSGCIHHENKEDILAKVEDRQLTRGALEEGQRLSYLSLGEETENWVDREVLLYHAKKSGIIEEDLFSEKMQDHAQNIIAKALLDSLMIEYIQIDPEQVRAYYANNIQDFQFTEDAALVTHLGLRYEEDARRIAELLKFSADNLDSLINLYNFDHGLVYRNRLLPSLSQVIFQAETNLFYGPIATAFGYHIIMVNRLFNNGETIPFTFVRRQIYERLFQMKLPSARSAILDSLREALNIEVHP